MPWKPTYTREQAAQALDGAEYWTDVMASLGLGYQGKTINVFRRWASHWGLDISHIEARSRPAYDREAAAQAVRDSRSWAEALRRLDMCAGGGNPAVLKKRVEEWGISTQHFDRQKPRERIPLEQVLVAGSTYSRSSLKERLFDTEIKHRRCEACGQGELWRGRRMSLILDHINGVGNDNRLENLRILCPNCAATLDTHCSRNRRRPARACMHCGGEFTPKRASQRYCSRACGSRWDRSRSQGGPRVARPSHQRLLALVKTRGYAAVARDYGVSDNAVRKWLRAYERELAEREGRDPESVVIPTRTWPSRLRGTAGPR